MRKYSQNHIRIIFSKISGYFLLFGTLIGFQACVNVDTFSNKIEKLDTNHEFKLADIDSRFSKQNLCVLSPYQNKVSSDFFDSDLINKKLEEIKFELTESATLIFFDSNYQLTVETLNGLYLRTLDNSTPTTEEVHQCGAVKDFQVYKFTTSTVAIYRR